MNKRPVTRRDLLHVAIAAIGIAIIGIYYGCEERGPRGYAGDAELVALAKTIRPVEPNYQLMLEWGDISQCWPARIEIDRTVRGTSNARVHLRHELDELWVGWLGADDPAAAARLDRDHESNSR